MAVLVVESARAACLQGLSTNFFCKDTLPARNNRKASLQLAMQMGAGLQVQVLKDGVGKLQHPLAALASSKFR